MDGPSPRHAGFRACHRPGGPCPQCLLRLRPWPDGADRSLDYGPADRRARRRAEAGHRSGALSGQPLWLSRAFTSSRDVTMAQQESIQAKVPQRAMNAAMARRAAEAAAEKAKEFGEQVSIAMVDESGNLVYFLRADS